jgi:AraC-like DNA-binding protein
MNWFYRTLLSYAPIFFVVLSSVIFVLFTTLNSASKNQYLETNRQILQQLVQYTDANLQLIERNIVSEMLKEEALKAFFSPEPMNAYDTFMLQKKLMEFAAAQPFATSIYLYNLHNGEILAFGKRYTPEDFGDWPFFASAYEEPGLEGWTGPRIYQPSPSDRQETVVSLFKYYPYRADNKGGVVVNIEVDSIVDVLKSLNRNLQGSIVLTGADEQPFQASMASGEDRLLFAQSSYTGWQYYANSVDATGFTMASLLSNIWILSGLVIILIAIVWFTVITHIHYKPIQNILGKIDPYTMRRHEGRKGKTSRNELKLIEGAIDRLLEKTVDYEHLHEERKRLKQQNLFYDLLTGSRKVSEAEWEAQMQESGLPHACDRFAVVVYEVDRYADFLERYSSRDQHLLKYILENTLREIAEQKNLFIWLAWVHPNRLSAVVRLPSEGSVDILQSICGEYRSWISVHLNLTVSAGIGKVVDSIGQIEGSYRIASQHVSYKAVFGPDTIIDEALVSTKSDFEKLKVYQPIVEMAHLFRMNDSQWIEKLDRIMKDMKATLVTQSDLAGFTDNLTRQLQKELQALPQEIQERWSMSYRDTFRDIARTVETVEELHGRLSGVMTQLAVEIEQDRVNRSNHSIALQIKAYIDENYADPNLSLNQVSELFGISPKSVSYLFKEEIGDKFMDYVLRIRFEHARHMLLETDYPIQQIAEQVGYTHVISFHRAFKKTFDMPPGEYRNLYRTAQ